MGNGVDAIVISLEEDGDSGGGIAVTHEGLYWVELSKKGTIINQTRLGGKS
jgi:hypothetical protein